MALPNATIRTALVPAYRPRARRTTLPLAGEPPTGRRILRFDTASWTPHPTRQPSRGEGIGRRRRSITRPASILRAGTDMYAPKNKATAEATSSTSPTSRIPPSARPPDDLRPQPRNFDASRRRHGPRLGRHPRCRLRPTRQRSLRLLPRDLGSGHRAVARARPHAVARVYHSTAILLRDGSVLSAGGEPHQTLLADLPAALSVQRAAADDHLGAGTIHLGQSFEVFTPDAPASTQVNLLKPGAVTHAYDQCQRFVPLTSWRCRSPRPSTARRAAYEAPARLTTALPGLRPGRSLDRRIRDGAGRGRVVNWATMP